MFKKVRCIVDSNFFGNRAVGEIVKGKLLCEGLGNHGTMGLIFFKKNSSQSECGCISLCKYDADKDLYVISDGDTYINFEDEAQYDKFMLLIKLAKATQ